MIVFFRCGFLGRIALVCHRSYDRIPRSPTRISWGIPAGGTSSGDDGRRSADDADEKSALKSFRAGAVVSNVWVEFILGKTRNFRREEGYQFLGKEKLLVVVPLFEPMT